MNTATSISSPNFSAHPQQVRLILQPAERLSAEQFSLAIWVNGNWFEEWRERNRLQCCSSNPPTQRVQIWLTQDNIRFRYLPSIPSTLTLFGRDLQINHQAFPLSLNINCWVELDRWVEIAEMNSQVICGRIMSGSVQFTDLDQNSQPFIGAEDFLAALWPSSPEGEQIHSLIVGRSQLQMEVGSQHRRLDFLGTTSDQPKSDRSGKLWQLVTDTIASETRLAQIQQMLIDASRSSVLPIKIRRSFSQVENIGIFYHVFSDEVDLAATEQEQLPRRSQIQVEEIIRPGLDLTFQSGERRETWIPQTLLIEQETQYKFLDFDLLHLLQNGSFATETQMEAALQVDWREQESNQPTAQIIKSPPLGLTDTTERDAIANQFLWQFGQTQLEETGPSLPGWIRYQIESIPLPKTVGQGLKRLPRLTGKLVFQSASNAEQQSWNWEVDVPQLERSEALESATQLQVKLSLSERKLLAASLEVYNPEITVTSPKIHVYPSGVENSGLRDPKSLPNSKNLKAFLDKNSTTSLKFRSFASTPQLGGIQLEFRSGADPIITSPNDQVIAYLPAPQALVDPIPPSGINSVSVNAENTSAFARDPNHGLIPVSLKKFSLLVSKLNPQLAILSCHSQAETEEKSFVEKAIRSTMALLPWVECSGTRSEFELKLFHRNLILEQEEFLSSREDRFADANAITPELFLPLEDFLYAVRDRYAEASTNLLQASSLLNWLPGAVLQNVDGALIEPQLTFGVVDGLPQVELSLNSTQVLSLRTQDSWLKTNLRWQNSDFDSAPTFILDNQENGQPLINSAAPLLFDPENRFVYDNLGVIRDRTLPQALTSWLIESIRYPVKDGNYTSIWSVSYWSKASLVEGNNTEICLACLNLKLATDGTLIEPNSLFQTTPFDLGAYGFFRNSSNGKEVDKNGTEAWWQEIQRLPVVCGMPIFVTRLTKMTIQDQQPQIIKFQAVLINPDDLVNNFQPGQKDVPSFVKAAVAKGAVLTITLQANGETFVLKSVTGRVDWTFTLTTQQSQETTQQSQKSGFSGKLARLQGSVTLDQGKLVIQPEDCYAYVFSRLWKVDLSQAQPLECTGNWENLQSSRLTIASREGFSEEHFSIDLKVSSTEDQNSLQFNLPLRLTEQPLKGYKLKASVTQGKQLQVTLQSEQDESIVDEAIPVIVQGPYYGFLLHQEKLQGKTYGRSVLVLWLEETISSEVMDFEQDENAIKQPKLGAILLKEIYKPQATAVLSGDSSENSITLSGPQIRLQIISTTIQEIVSWYLTPLENESSPQMTLHIGEQLLYQSQPEQPTPAITAYLTYQLPTGSELQGPILLKPLQPDQSLQFDRFQVVSAVYHARAVISEEESGTTQRDISLPHPESSIAESFDLVEISRQAGQKNHFIKLAFDGASFHLQEISDKQVPLDPILDQTLIQPIPTQPLRVPQLVHRQVYGARLRIRPYNALTQEDQWGEETTWTAPSGTWLLDPVAQQNCQIQLLEGSLFLKSVTSDELDSSDQSRLQTENLFVVRRSQSTATSSLDLPLTNLLSITSSEKEEQSSADSFYFNEQRIKEYLIQKGASGIAIHRVLSQKFSNAPSDRGLYRFVASPFYDQRIASFAGNSTPNTSKAQVAIAETTTLDRRLLLPKQLLSWNLDYWNLDLSNRYIPALVSLPSSQQVQLPQRTIRLERLQKQKDQQPGGTAETHHLQLVEATAFRTQDPLNPLPEEDRLQGTPAEKKLATFLPQNLELRYGLDKPGATFHHKFQSYSVGTEKQVTSELLTDFVLREPQQFRLPEGAKISITGNLQSRNVLIEEAQLEVVPIEVAWEEVLGAVDLSSLDDNLTVEVDQTADPKKVINRPFKLVTQINQSFFEVAWEDPTLPISQGKAPGNQVSQRLYIVTKIKDLNRVSIKNKGDSDFTFKSPEFIVDKPLNELFKQQAFMGGYYIWMSEGNWTQQLTTLSAFYKPQSSTEDITIFGEKTIKWISSTNLPAKLALILSHQKEGSHFERCLLFGNSADVSKGYVKVIGKTLQYVMKDNDEVDVILPEDIVLGTETRIFLMKYLATGQVLFDQKSFSLP